MPFGHAVNEVNGYPLLDTPNLITPSGLQRLAMSKLADCHPAEPLYDVGKGPRLRGRAPNRVG